VRGGIVYFDGLIAHVPSSLSGSIAVLIESALCH
jgi:hypothetical protein